MTTEKFLQLGRMLAKSNGLPDLKFAVIPHPLGGLLPEVARTRGEIVAQTVLDVLKMTDDQEEVV
ncbi:MAG: hypothetical protein FWG47_07380 [Propionibacteriaceae bacterium]|nr:hypothetical protein [Propionibacteriaceae bacterium]